MMTIQVRPFLIFCHKLYKEGLHHKGVVEAVALAGVDIRRTLSGVSLEFRKAERAICCTRTI